MSPLFLYNGKLLTVDNKLAANGACCCPTDGENCNASSPYNNNDPCYQQVIAADPFCCNVQWDDLCQSAYNNCQNQ